MQKANPMKASPNPDLTERKGNVLPLSKQELCSKSRLMLSLENVINRFFLTFQFNKGYLIIVIGYCYHTVHVNTFVLTENDDNKQFLF
jgi:hypothetical protein